MTYIFGNPPFIGHQTKAPQQRDELKAVWGKDANGHLDYVTGWHALQAGTVETVRSGVGLPQGTGYRFAVLVGHSPPGIEEATL